MKAIIKFVILLGAFFTFTLIAFKLLGILSTDDIKGRLEVAMDLSPWVVGLIIIALMFIDLLIAIPTLSLTILSVFFRGRAWGTLFKYWNDKVGNDGLNNLSFSW